MFPIAAEGGAGAGSRGAGRVVGERGWVRCKAFLDNELRHVAEEVCRVHCVGENGMKRCVRSGAVVYRNSEVSM